MTIRFTCAECSSVLKIKDELAGTSARCPKCKTKFVVPDPPDESTPSHQETHEEQPDRPQPVNGESQSQASQDDVSTSAHETGSTLEQPDSTGDTTELPAATMESTESEPLPATRIELPSESDSDESDVDSNDSSPLQLEDRGNDVPVAAAPEASQEISPVSSAAIEDVDDDLDCPSMLVSPFMSQKNSEVEAPEPRRFGASRVAADVASDFTSKSPQMPKPTRREEPIDPMKFLVDDVDDDNEEDEEEVPVKSSRTFTAPPDSDADLSLSEDFDDETPPRPTPQPMTRRTPVAPSSRPAPEKIDLETAAKMMKKAIKDSQADATRQREINARPGYDYTLFFREFGLRGLAILLVAIVGPGILYFGFDYMLANKLKLPKLGYVSGTIKLDGKPLAGAMVYIAPVDTTLVGGKRERIRTSIGVSNEAGHFKMMYTPDIEGVAAGKCRVWLSNTGSYIPIDWMELSMRSTEVAVGSQKTPFDINLETKKK